MRITGDLAPKLQERIVRALLTCESVGGAPASRRGVIKDLPSETRHRIEDSDIPINAVANIVRASSRHVGGLNELRTAVLRYEGHSFGYQELSIAFAEVEVLYQYPGPAVPIKKSIRLSFHTHTGI